MNNLDYLVAALDDFLAIAPNANSLRDYLLPEDEAKLPMTPEQFIEVAKRLRAGAYKAVQERA